MNRRIESWNGREITTILTVAGSIRTVVLRKIWRKIMDQNTWENHYKETVAVLKLYNVQQGANTIFKHRSYTGISIGV